MVRIVRGAGAAAALVAAFAFGGRQARAASLERPVGSYLIDDDGDDEDIGPVIKEVEKGLNELFLVDESKQLRVRKDFREGLPLPAEQLERMISGFAGVGDDGKIHIKDPDQVRPYLPMMKNFLKRGGVDQLKKMKEDLAKKSPEERKAAIQKLMEQGRQFGMVPQPEPEDDGKDKKKEKRKDDGDEKRREEKRTEERRIIEKKLAGERDGREPRGLLEERIAKLEARVEKLTSLLERMMNERGGAPARPGERGERRFSFVFPPGGERGGERDDGWRREPWGMRGEPGRARPRTEERGARGRREAPRDDRREGREGDRRGPRFDFFRGGDPEQMRQRLEEGFRALERHFRDMERDMRERFDRDGGRRDERRSERRDDRRRGRDRDEDEDDDDDDDRGGFSLRGDDLRDVIGGLRQFAKILEPRDVELLLRVVEKVSRDFDPRDLQDQGKLLSKIQESVEPEDMGRLMEIVSEFMATPEGRALAHRLGDFGGQLPKLQPRREAPRAPRRAAELY